ncbi:aminoglycoside phosphotransferase family protein [Actinoplanes sp. NPDC051346]|uniref:aminoglycoside phosphotransferase family protein n=1 Tax=Actinoplanes sp. NPDC051346 TaxID=3155048 RepID=UPI003433F661
MATAAPSFDKTTADVSLAAAASRLDLCLDNAELIRIGSAAVYWLNNRTIVARVSRSLDLLPVAVNEIAVSKWLAGAGVPAVIALEVAQPVVVGEHVVTFWESVSDREAYGTTSELGQLLRALHELSAPRNITLPELKPFDRLESRIRAAVALDEADREFLLRRVLELSTAYERLEFPLGVGVVHGDASVGNVLRTWTDDVVLSDLDGFAYGPREWDLLLTAMFFERYGWHTDGEYRAFVDTYGVDVMRWDGYKVLADTRELSMVTWLSQNVTSSDSARQEFTKRIETLRTDGSRRSWKPL